MARERMRNMYDEMFTKIKGIASQNKFEVELGKPSGLPPDLRDDIKRVSFNTVGQDLKDEGLSTDVMRIMAQSVTLPTKTFKTFTTYQGVVPNERPYQLNYSPLVITFIMDSGGIVFDYIWRWLNTVYNFETNTFNFYDEYVADINVKSFDEHGLLLLDITYVDAYPVIQNEMMFDSKIMNNAQQFPVTFNYRKIRVENYGEEVFRYGYK